MIFIAGLLAGLGLYRLGSRAERQKKQLQEELTAVRTQFAHHQQTVNDHFKRSAEMLTALQQQHQALVQLNRQASETLCSENIPLGPYFAHVDSPASPHQMAGLPQQHTPLDKTSSKTAAAMKNYAALEEATANAS